MQNPPVVEIVDLRKTYGDTVAVAGVSLQVCRGEVFGVLGPNGAGKTTIVECAAGLRRPDGGTVRVLGLDPAADPDAVRQRVGIQLQRAAFPQRMTDAGTGTGVRETRRTILVTVAVTCRS